MLWRNQDAVAMSEDEPHPVGRVDSRLFKAGKDAVAVVALTLEVHGVGFFDLLEENG